MNFTPERAAIRFGCGLSPRHAAPASADDMLALLQGSDRAATEFPIPGMDPVYALILRERAARKEQKAATDEKAQQAALEKMKFERRASRKDAAKWLGQTLMRRSQTEDGFRERLVSFWADHFTAQGKRSILYIAPVNYAEEAIRPHVAGTFSDMLRAAITHPLMLHYLDQFRSVGPNSKAGKRNTDRGLNENLARELMELHTLGVDGPYTQFDVRQLAELLTGLNFSMKEGFFFRSNMSDPGEKTVLGRHYTGSDDLEAVHAVLDDLAVHPATARHIASKLAVHFVGDQPDPALVEALEVRFNQTKGDLSAVYEVLLKHPAAWDLRPGNVKQPIDFIGSSLRALDLHARQMPGEKLGKMQKFFYNPLVLMGQKIGQPAGPDGWPEEDADWISPQRLAARLQWAMFAPLRLRRSLPDPREFVDIALGPAATEQVQFAAKAAETRAEGVGIVLASAAFQRS
ncbi:MAG: DUF1800 domain-containing protein [Pseudomonadota bacterium]